MKANLGYKRLTLSKVKETKFSWPCFIIAKYLYIAVVLSLSCLSAIFKYRNDRSIENLSFQSLGVLESVGAFVKLVKGFTLMALGTSLLTSYVAFQSSMFISSFL